MPRHRWYGMVANNLAHENANRDPVAAMQDRVEALLDQSEQWRRPVNLALLASFRGIAKVEVVPLRQAGRLIHKPGQSIIQVNSNHSVGKQNFSIAHEICHTLLPGYYANDADIVDSETGEYNPHKEEEYLCDIGASALLLNHRWLIPTANELGPSLASLLDISRRAAASLQATGMALTQADVWRCAIIFWEEGWRKDQRQNPHQMGFPEIENELRIPAELRVTFPYPSPSFGVFVPKNKSVPRTTSIFQCFETHRTTIQRERLDFGKGEAEYCVESMFVPYTRNGASHARVISLIQSDAFVSHKEPSEQSLYLNELL